MADTIDGPTTRTEEQRAVPFDELARGKGRQNSPPNGFAIAALITGVVSFVSGTVFSPFLGIFWGLVTLVYAIPALVQIRHREARGTLLVVAGVAVVVAWAVFITVLLSR